MSEFEYQGHELELFQHAVNWKRYYASQIGPAIHGDVLEVGAGIGGTARFLCKKHHRSWTCLEPDRRLIERLEESLSRQPLPVPARAICATLETLAPSETFDAVIYIDVLEHIEHDAAELARAARRVRPGGHLVVLSPAHDRLFSEFDKAIGHWRRYSASSLTALRPPEVALERVFYLDSVGMLASFANRAILAASYPTQGQIRFWDSALVRMSRVLDPLLGRRLGKTVIAIWTRLEPA